MNVIKFNKEQTLSIKLDCNNKCTDCSQSGKNYSYDEIKKIIDNIKSSNSLNNELFITGNEPFLRKDILDILDYTNSNNIHTTIKTNGRMFSYLDLVKKIKTEDIIVEIKSTNREKHDKVTQIDGAFDQTMRGIKNLVSENKTVILKWDILNLERITNYIDFSKSLNVKKICLSFQENIENNERIQAIKNAIDYANENNITLFFMNETKNLRYLSIYYHEALVGPEFLEIDICDSCNLKCNYCWDHSPLLSSEKTPCSQDKDIIERIIKEASTIGVQSIGFAGNGEPFLHKDIKDILKIVEHEELELNILTNGTLLSDEIIEILAKNGYSLRINISAGSQSSYTKIHNTNKITYDKLIENLKALSSRYNSSGFLKNIEGLFVITKENYTEIDEMINLVSECGLKRARFILMTPIKETEQLILNDSEIIEYKRILNRANMNAKDNNIKTNILDINDSIEKTYKGFYGDSLGCYWNYFFTRIEMDGTINMCGELPIKELNINNNSLKEIFNSSIIAKMRKRLELSDFPNNPELKCKCCNDIDSNLKISKKLKEYNLKN